MKNETKIIRKKKKNHDMNTTDIRDKFNELSTDYDKLDEQIPIKIFITM